MILQEKIKKKAEGFGKLAPVFLEGAEFALNNQWINVNEDLPCNHKELLDNKQCSKTFKVFVTNIYGENWSDYMIYKNGKWRWNSYEPDYWMPAPKLPKEQEIKL